MIDKVRVVNDRAIDKTLTLGEVSDGVVVQNITGLGPVKAELITSPKTQGAGMHYNGKRYGARNLVFEIGLSRYGSKSVGNVRSDVYNYFPVGETVWLEFVTDDGYHRNIEGIVESVEPDIFASEPTMQVSVMCLANPFFSGDPYTLMVEPGSNGSVFTYSGRIETGVTIEIVPTGQYIPGSLMGEFSLTQMTSNMVQRQINFHDFDLNSLTGGRLKLGDRVLIRTTPGYKSAQLIRDNVTYNIFPALKDVTGAFLQQEQYPLLRPAELTSFEYEHDSYDSNLLDVKVTWVDLIEGL